MELQIIASGAKLRITGAKPAPATVRLAGEYRIRAEGQATFHTFYPLEVSAGKGRLLLTARIPREEYVAAVLAGESGNFSSPESLKAMAIAVRTYAMRFRDRHRSEGFDFCDTTHCQDLRIGGVAGALRQAAESTEGELLWYQGRPAATYYHRDCGGSTEASQSVWPDTRAPYLRQQADAYCVSRGRKSWQSAIELGELQAALAGSGVTTPRNIKSVSVSSRTPGGRARRLSFSGTHTVLVSASTLRVAVGRGLGWSLIRSDYYDASERGDKVFFQGYGAGHGVGLCQAGAARMGEEGHNYREILAYYYPGTSTGITAQGIPWKRISGERVDLFTTNASDDGTVIAETERLLAAAERSIGRHTEERPQVRVFPSVGIFRDATGEPGWVAASTRGREIRLQPAALLRSRGILESTLRHELLHMLTEARARVGLPLWFREGLVLYLEEPSHAIRADAGQTNPEEIERVLEHPQSRSELETAYRNANTLVASLIERNGQSQVLRWLEQGFPPDAAGLNR